MSSPTPGYDPNNSQGAQPGWGAPQQPGHPQAGYAAAPPYAGGSAPAPTMGMPDAVRSVLTQYATFTGRARRAEFWWFYLASVLASVVASIIDQILGSPILGILLTLALIVPTLAVGARRLHDTGKSGWWQLIGLVPIVGAIVLIVFCCQDSQPGTNNWGPSPKYPAASGY
jgi:uncharacterized membrane protein YhaH (DUF805 family)